MGSERRKRKREIRPGRRCVVFFSYTITVGHVRAFPFTYNFYLFLLQSSRLTDMPPSSSSSSSSCSSSTTTTTTTQSYPNTPSHLQTQTRYTTTRSRRLTHTLLGLLPTDVLPHILSYLSGPKHRQDLHACTLVNKWFHRIANPLLYSILETRGGGGGGGGGGQGGGMWADKGGFGGGAGLGLGGGYVDVSLLSSISVLAHRTKGRPGHGTFRVVPMCACARVLVGH